MQQHTSLSYSRDKEYTMIQQNETHDLERIEHKISFSIQFNNQKRNIHHTCEKDSVYYISKIFLFNFLI